MTEAEGRSSKTCTKGLLDRIRMLTKCSSASILSLAMQKQVHCLQSYMPTWRSCIDCVQIVYRLCIDCRCCRFNDCSGGWFGTFLFFHFFGIIIQTDELTFCRGVGQPPLWDEAKTTGPEILKQLGILGSARGLLLNGSSIALLTNIMNGS